MKNRLFGLPFLFLRLRPGLSLPQLSASIVVLTVSLMCSRLLLIRQPAPVLRLILVSVVSSLLDPCGANCVRVLGNGLDATGFPILTRLSGSVTDQLWSRIDPQRDTADWRPNRTPRVSSLVNIRTTLGQFVSHKAPNREAYNPYRKGNSPFNSYRVVFLNRAGFQ